jgi:hypothetical protein
MKDERRMLGSICDARTRSYGALQILIQNEKSPEYYEVQWNASRVPSGIYFYRQQARQTDGGQAGEYVETKKMVLWR